MAWGARGSGNGVDDWVQRLHRQDPSLKSLHVLKMRRFGHGEVEKLCDVLKTNTVLTELYASGHEMPPATALVVGEMLGVNQTLTALCVGDTAFGDEGVAALCKGVRSSRSLAVLDLENKSLTSASGEHLQSTLSANQSLKQLKLARNNLADEGMGLLCRALEHSTVEDLDVSETGITQHGAMHIAAALSATSSSLRRLVLSHNDIAPDGVVTLARGLAENISLEVLEMEGCGVGDNGARALLAGLQENCAEQRGGQLHTLVLTKCTIGSSGGTGMAAALPGCTTLRTLNLEGNDLGDVGTTELARAVQHGGQGPAGGVEKLDLGGSAVGQEGLEYLAQAPSLRSLSLFNSRIGDDGAKCLASLLSQGHMAELLDLNICACEITMNGMTALCQALGRGGAPSLQTLEIAANPASQADIFEETMTDFRVARPTIDVNWRASDPGEKDGDKGASPA